MLPQAATKDAVPSARSARWGRWQPEGLTEGVDRLGANGKVVLCHQRCATVGFKPHPSSRLRHDATLSAFGEGKDSP